jgi:(2S)-methylsuccinyl-CoA dehydrogenase
VFGLTIPEEFGGLGLGKLAMCVVSEELSRGWIAPARSGTRSEIAGELILLGGTEEQKQQWLPRIASARSCPRPSSPNPTPAPTSASLRTRAVRDGDVYKVTGQQDLDHPCGARRRDDAAGAHRSR